MIDGSSPDTRLSFLGIQTFEQVIETDAAHSSFELWRFAPDGESGSWRGRHIGLAVAELPQGAEWTYEIKLDGLKAVRHEVVS
jgi:hypothetical protein